MQTIECDLCSTPIETKLVGPGARLKKPGNQWSVSEPITVIVNNGWPQQLRYDFHEACYSLGLSKIGAEWTKWKKAKETVELKPKREKAILEVKPRKKPKRKKDA